MDYSEFFKINRGKLLTILISLVISIFCVVCISSDVGAEKEQQTAKVETRVETVVIEKVVEVEREVVEIETEMAYFDVPLSHEVQDTIFVECEKYGISPAIIVAMIERESRYKESVVGDNGRSFGLMQIQKRWHEQRMADCGCDDLLDPIQNVKVGIDYLAELKEKNGNIFWMLHGYNGGIAYANKQAKNGDVSDYAASVIARAYELGGDLNAIH